MSSAQGNDISKEVKEMIYSITNGILSRDPGERPALAADTQYVWISSVKELETVGSELHFNDALRSEIQASRDVSKHESREGFDFISLSIPADLYLEKIPQHVYLFLTEKMLVFLCGNDDVIEKIISDYLSESAKKASLSRILHQYFDRLTFDDSLALKKIEQEISVLEESLIVSKKSDFFFLVSYRKKLLELKVYYEQLLEIFEAIEQNENELVAKTELRLFRILAGRANRLYNGVTNLRDYVTQVREAYQTQIDINLNSVMKVFTVITSIFFPLTLIVGWYGMNLRMPEFGWRYGYLFVIALSVATAVATLLYFKKNKWF